MRYEKVTYRPEGGRVRTVILREPRVVTGALATLLVGTEVDKDGNAVLDGPRYTTVERTHVIDVDLVVKRVEVAMDLTYGTFEPIP